MIQGWLQQFEEAGQIFNLAVYLGFGFVGMMLALRSKREEFSLLIPYVRFRQDALHDLPVLLEFQRHHRRTSGPVWSKPASWEKRSSSPNSSSMNSSFSPIPAMRTSGARGKRAWENLKKLQANEKIEITILESDDLVESTVDAKLTELGQRMNARILTNDANLAKIGRLKGIAVLNLNELAVALRPALENGDELELQLVKEGKDHHQAVGYLDDGTMIVVNHGADQIGSRQRVVVSSTVQTNAGRLIFADLKSG